MKPAWVRLIFWGVSCGLMAGTVGFVLRIQHEMYDVHFSSSLPAEAIPPLTNGRLHPSEKSGIKFATLITGRILEAPQIYLGFDPPPASFARSIFRRTYVQIVGGMSRVGAPMELSTTSLSSLTAVPFFTNDELAYYRFKSILPTLSWLPNADAVIQQVNHHPPSLGLLKSSDMRPSVTSLSEETPIDLWLGWKTNEVPFLEEMGINRKLNDRVAELLNKPDIAPPLRVMTLLAVGDVMLGRNIERRFLKRQQKNTLTTYPFEDVADFLKKGDITVGNLECSISTQGAPMPGKDYTFRASPREARRLKKAGFDLMSLANNHAKDYGSEALIDTLFYLRREGILTVGAGRTLKEARQPQVITLKDGTRVGFLGFTDVLPVDFLAESKRPGVAWAKRSWIKSDIENLRAHCDLLVVLYHWGVEYTASPTAKQRDLAHVTIDWGADLVIGHHPHWIQEVEFYRHGFITYSLGNFIFDMNHRPKVTEGLILTCQLKDRRLHQVAFDPVSIRDGQPQIIPWSDATSGRTRKIILSEMLLKDKDHLTSRR